MTKGKDVMERCASERRPGQYTHTHTHTHTHTQTHTYTHNRTHTHTITHIHTQSRAHTHNHTHTHTIARTHTHTHTQSKGGIIRMQKHRDAAQCPKVCVGTRQGGHEEGAPPTRTRRIWIDGAHKRVGAGGGECGGLQAQSWQRRVDLTWAHLSEAAIPRRTVQVQPGKQHRGGVRCGRQQRWRGHIKHNRVQACTAVVRILLSESGEERVRVEKGSQPELARPRLRQQLAA